MRKKEIIKKASLMVPASVVVITGLGPTINHDQQSNYSFAPSNIAYANDDEDWNYSRPGQEDRCDEIEIKNPNTIEEEDAAVGVEGDWLTEGSEEYNVAKQIFDMFTEDYGTSGEFAAGVIANVKHESGFIPDRAQGLGELRFGMDSKEAPAGIQGGGGGLFQFTPYTKYTDSGYWDRGDEGWAVDTQIAAVWAFEFQNREVMTYLKMNAADSARNPHGYTSYSTIEDWLSTDDAVRASWAFQIGYERPKQYHSDREALAKQANQVFNADNIEADPSKYQLDGGSDGGSDNDNDSGSDDVIDGTKDPEELSEEEQLAKDCGVEINPASDIGAASWGDDGSGEHSESVSSKQYYSRDDLPEELREYSIHPEDVGMSWGSRDGWIDAGWASGGQCTNLSASFLAAIWQQDGTDARGLLDGRNTGNGDVTARTMAGHFGGAVTKEPRKGAVYSVPIGEDGTGGYGHTGIVGHVFENGDVLMVEQNTPYSGDMIDQPLTWNYVLYEASYLNSMNFSYYYPGDDDWEPADVYKNSESSGSDD